MNLPEQFVRYIKEKHLVNNGQGVLLAVSGGVDSMVMAELFHKAGMPFAIAHCNFQLRGKDADLDEALVRAWCLQRGITFHSTGFETKKIAEEWKKGIQETARILRYEWFDAICDEHKYAKIATAHHANDNVETLLMNLFKGTGISGLHGIRAENNKIIRPLLFAEKEDIKAYAEQHNIRYREDASNASDAYLRNALRLNIIPRIKELIPNVVLNINDSIGRFIQAEELYKKAIEQERKKLLERRGKDYYIPVLKLRNRLPLETICYELFSPFGFTSAQVPHIIELLSAPSGKLIASSTHRIIRDRDFLAVTSLASAETDILLIEGIPCQVQAGNFHFSFSVEKKPKTIPTDNTIACIDMKRIEFPIVLRKWTLGDYFYPLGMGMKKKKLSRFFIDHKLAVHEKEHIWVLECSKRIAWVAGMRLDERFKIKESTEMVMRIEMRKV
jgi:tRNA(Ile)-lysidine synthase